MNPAGTAAAAASVSTSPCPTTSSLLATSPDRTAARLITQPWPIPTPESECTARRDATAGVRSAAPASPRRSLPVSSTRPANLPNIQRTNSGCSTAGIATPGSTARTSTTSPWAATARPPKLVGTSAQVSALRETWLASNFTRPKNDFLFCFEPRNAAGLFLRVEENSTARSAGCPMSDS